MRTIEVTLHASVTADAAFASLAGLPDRRHVPFRGGAIRWTQRCDPAPRDRTIGFALLDGDFRDLTGWWAVAPADGGCEVRFQARYDIGVPIYDRILDPLVAKVLSDHVRAVVADLDS